MSENQSITWRLGHDTKLHAIKDCDPDASGWISECGRFITGPESGEADCCLECCQKVTRSALETSTDKAQAGLELSIYRKGIVDSAALCRELAEKNSDSLEHNAFLYAASALLDLAQSLVKMPNDKLTP